MFNPWSSQFHIDDFFSLTHVRNTQPQVLFTADLRQFGDRLTTKTQTKKAELSGQSPDESKMETLVTEEIIIETKPKVLMLDAFPRQKRRNREDVLQGTTEREKRRKG